MHESDEAQVFRYDSLDRANNVARRMDAEFDHVIVHLSYCDNVKSWLVVAW